ncbi:MAG: 3-oxoacyl-[acyl-carrier-protein] synthase III C-terminal domain-containing protein, partial [Verrucomicrobiota bacterium]
RKLQKHEKNYTPYLLEMQAAIWGMDRFPCNLDRFGNTSAASIPLALEEAWRNGRVRHGDLVLLVAFGAGLTWGATLLRWHEPKN